MEVANPPSTEETQPLFRKRGTKNTSTLRKRPATPPPASDSDTSGYSSASGDDENEGRTVKRRRKTAAITASSSTLAKPAISDDITSTTTKYSGDRSAKIEENNDATKHSNWYDDNPSSASSKALLGTTRPLPTSHQHQHQKQPPTNNPSDDGPTYHGTSNYQSHIAKNPNAPPSSSSKTVVGPIKAPTNVRTITTTDFAPDVCKDYKQTGFCGFGDGCKFLHAREDYKQGWELDREWEKVGPGGAKNNGKSNRTRATAAEGNDGEEEEEDALLATIPFACILCKSSYKTPVVTRCSHYFCEACALKRYRKTPSCA
ncbi:MAG: hypothetical protein Q9212_006838, partial [Teloschistes hypoglaucus]